MPTIANYRGIIPAIACPFTADNIDPHKVWACLMSNEKPGGHGERSVAVGTIDMAVRDAVAKVARHPLHELLARRYGNGKANPHVFVYAAVAGVAAFGGRGTGERSRTSEVLLGENRI
jgi:L-alanine-DL-glutamate epimerase-like enolase superfamily enzyme